MIGIIRRIIGSLVITLAPPWRQSTRPYEPKGDRRYRRITSIAPSPNLARATSDEIPARGITTIGQLPRPTRTVEAASIGGHFYFCEVHGCRIVSIEVDDGRCIIV